MNRFARRGNQPVHISYTQLVRSARGQRPSTTPTRLSVLRLVDARGYRAVESVSARERELRLHPREAPTRIGGVFRVRGRAWRRGAEPGPPTAPLGTAARGAEGGGVLQARRARAALP